jgi:hypothetical protein
MLMAWMHDAHSCLVWMVYYEVCALAHVCAQTILSSGRCEQTLAGGQYLSHSMPVWLVVCVVALHSVIVGESECVFAPTCVR